MQLVQVLLVLSAEHVKTSIEGNCGDLSETSDRLMQLCSLSKTGFCISWKDGSRGVWVILLECSDFPSKREADAKTHSYRWLNMWVGWKENSTLNSVLHLFRLPRSLTQAAPSWWLETIQLSFGTFSCIWREHKCSEHRKRMMKRNYFHCVNTRRSEVSWWRFNRGSN